MKVLFGEYLTWKTLYRVGSHYYARHFIEKGWDVGWLGGELHPLNLLHNRAELRRKWPIWRQGGIEHQPGPWEYTPFKLAPYRSWGPLEAEMLAWQGPRLTVPPVRRVLARRGFDQADLLWLSNPQAYPWLMNMPGYRRMVYRVADNHAMIPGVPSSIRHIEEQIAQRADVIFVVHPNQMDWFSERAPGRTYYLPNGVDLKRFDKQTARPPEYGPVDQERPIAVYVGSIGHRFDASLLGAVAKRRPAWRFVLIGQAGKPLPELVGLPNVIFLGPQCPDNIPAYLQHAQAGLVPFVDKAASRTPSLKMYEYLACGLPVIHSSLSKDIANSMPVWVSSGVNPFCIALDRALTVTEKERAEFRSYAAENRWESRFHKVDHIIEKILT